MIIIGLSSSANPYIRLSNLIDYKNVGYGIYDVPLMNIERNDIMTEAAIKRAKKQKINRVIFISVTILIAALLVLWGIQYYNVNKNAIKQEIEYYEMGEFVEIGDNFYYSAGENLNGYSIRINSAKLEDYIEYVEKNGGEIREENYSADYPVPKYIAVLDMTVKNEGNTEGGVNTHYYWLYTDALCLSIDYEVLALVEEYFTGYVGFKIVEDTEADMTMTFASMGSDAGLDFDGLNKKLEENEFYFSVCEWPVRKVIKVKFDK